MEQRKRESLIPKGTFELDASLQDDRRGDVSGTFLRSEVELPPSPVARIELKRKVLPPPPPPAATRQSLRPAPPKAPSLLPPPPPRVPTTTPEAGSLRALIAPSYPPPAPVVEQPERIDFQDFALRLDVAPIAPAPSSLLPPPNEQRPTSLRAVLVLLALVAVGAGGWLSRGWLAAPRASSARTDRVAPTPVVSAPIAAVVAPSAPPVVAPTAPVAVVQAPAAVPDVVSEVAAPAVVAPPTTIVPAVVKPKLAPATPTIHAAPSTAAPVAAVEASTAATPVDTTPAQAEASAPPALEPATEPVAEEPLPETLAREEVVEGIEILRNEYQACAGDVHGTAEIRITIASTGRITHALVGGDFAGTPQGSCLARTLRQARFRSFLQPRLDIVYPIAL